MEYTNKKQIILIGRNHYGRVPMHELMNIVTKLADQPKCKRCGNTDNIMLNGYCVDCEEELTSKLIKG